MVTDPTMRISYLVHALSGMFRRRIEQALRPVGLTEAQLAVLIQLAIGPDAGLPSGDLARRAATTEDSLARDLTGLSGRGLVVCDGQPGTMSWVRITEPGRDLVVQAGRLAEPVEADALRLLSSGEPEVLRALLLRTMTALERTHE